MIQIHPRKGWRHHQHHRLLLRAPSHRALGLPLRPGPRPYCRLDELGISCVRLCGHRGGGQLRCEREEDIQPAFAKGGLDGLLACAWRGVGGI